MTAPSVPVSPPPHTAETSPWDVLAPAGVLVVVALLARTFVAKQPFGLDNDGSVQAVALGVAVAAFLIIGWGLKLAEEGREKAFQRLRDRTLVALGLCGAFAYFNFGHLHFGGFVHVWDTYHYYIGAKYFPEVGYEHMYDCAAVVDAENGRLAELQRRNHTDLKTNLIVPTREAIENPDQICKQYFTPERWREYSADINSIHKMVNETRWKEIHLDHGYNATPVWTLAGLFFANREPATTEGLTHVNLLDPIYIFLSLLMIWWAFGPRGFALAAIVLGCNFPNRYYWTGGAFLRHDWLFFLVASVCLLKKDKPFLGGLAFSYTVLLRLFPGLAALGPALAAVEYVRRNKALDPAFVKYLAGGAVGTAVLVGASFVLLATPPPNTLTVDTQQTDSGALKVLVTRVDRKTGAPSTWLKGPNLVVGSTLPGFTIQPLEGASGFIIAGTAGATDTTAAEGSGAAQLTVKIGGDETLTIPIAIGETARQVAQKVADAFTEKARIEADGSGISMWKRFAANTVKHASTPLTNLMGLKTVLTYRPSTVGAQLTDRTLIDAWKPWKDMKTELWRQMKPVFAGIVLLAVVLVYFALRSWGPSLYVAAALGVGFCVVAAELTNYYYCFLLPMAALYSEKREVGFIMSALSAVTLIINFGWVQGLGINQSRELDQQYTAMSLASVVAMFGVWWSFTAWGRQAEGPAESPPGPFHSRWAIAGLAVMSLFVLNRASASDMGWGAPISDPGFGFKVWVLVVAAVYGLSRSRWLGRGDPLLAAPAGPAVAPPSEKKKNRKK